MFRQRFRPYLESDNVMFTFIKVFLSFVYSVILVLIPRVKFTFHPFSTFCYCFFSIYLSSDIVSLVII